MLKITWRTAGSRRTAVGSTTGTGGTTRAFGISGMPEIGNAAPSRPCANGAMRRFVVCRPVPGISHPVIAYCVSKREREWKIKRRRGTYEVPIPKQLGQLSKAVVVCPRCGLNTHEHGVGSLNPLLEVIHLDCGPRWRKV